MDYESVLRVCKKAIRENRYVMIRYNGMYRNVYPISFRRGPGGYRLFAWCELHPTEQSESFLLDKIVYAVVSQDEALIKPMFVEEI